MDLIRCESLHGFEALVNKLGGTPDDILAHCQLPQSLLSFQQEFISYRDYILLLETAAQQLDCSDFGIRLASMQTIDILGPLALAAKQATTLGEALNWVINYIHFHVSGLEVNVTTVPDTDDALLTFSITLLPLPVAKQTVELTLALACQFTTFLSGGRCHAKAIYLPHGFQQGSVRAKQILGSPVVSDQPLAALQIEQQDLSLSVDSEQTALSDAATLFLHNHCNTKDTSLSQKVSVIIKAMLMFELCNNQVVAAALDLSIRQLHRGLAKEGTSFVKLKSLVRKELSQHYLVQANLSLGRIAELLGYQEQSAFSKACWLWFGCGARAARNKLQAAEG